ncbi:MAG: hypothetical protein D1H97_17770 [Paracoccus sp. BP8]|nr:MAG: hypothetical protein D1H97_17770 [Paracoccus sp. BP8]
MSGKDSPASPPCLAAEIAPDYFDPLAVEPQQARDVARWRKARRERPASPLAFHRWSPGAPMRRGHWNIPVPASIEAVEPDVVLAPLVGWDGRGYRLGYGGGYFDRTLAARRPLAVGTGLQSARLATIYPQPHDIPLAAIVTETGLQYDGAVPAGR